MVVIFTKNEKTPPRNKLVKLHVFFLLSVCLHANLLFSSVTVIGREGAALCYQAAEIGNSGYSSINTCLKALQDQFLTTQDRSGTQINLGIVLNNSFLPDRALRAFSKAKISEELKPEILLNSGNSYFIKTEFWKAIEYYDKSIKSGLKNKSAALYNKGLSYEMLKDMKGAILNYKKALLLKPDKVYLEKKGKLVEGGSWSE